MDRKNHLENGPFIIIQSLMMIITTFLQAFICTSSLRKNPFQSTLPLFLVGKMLTSFSLAQSSQSSSCSATPITTNEVGQEDRNDNNNNNNNNVDLQYPGTSVIRMKNIRKRVEQLTVDQLNGDWEDVRRNILWSGGLKDLPNAVPGQGYTGHSFNDFNHCDLTAILGDDVNNNNNGRVAGIAFNNHLGSGIKIASLPELGPGGSWSTCMIGCAKDPPQDVAHVQFRSRIAFKLVWVPPNFDSFVLVDDDGRQLAYGKPTGKLPDKTERVQNYRVVHGSKYAMAADRLSTVVLSSSSLGNSTGPQSGAF